MDLSKEEVQNLIPGYVIEIAEVLQKNNYEAFLVGGSVRDILLGKEPSDYDIATDAYPEKIEQLFEKSIPTGAKFGTMVVVMKDEHGESYDVEVTTYRSEADYVGGRWPSKVAFTKTIEEDLSRRDFTINAIALDLQNFDTDMKLADLIKDPHSGMKDLKSGTIRAVGNPIERFTEDGLRPVRACRLAAQLGFKVEPATLAAIKPTNYISEKVSVERFRDELLKLLDNAHKPSIGLKLMHKSGLLKLFLPELEEGIGVTQPEFHDDDVFDHSLLTCDVAEDRIKLAALLHDIGKPRTMTKDEKGTHFYSHDVVGAEMTREIMQRLRFPNAETERVANLVRWHMFYYPSADWRKEVNSRDELERDGGLLDHDIDETLASEKQEKVQGGWTDGAVRRFIRNVGGQDAIDDLMRLRIADASANPKSPFNPKEIDALSERISEVRAGQMALTINDLDLTGHDLMNEFNKEAGPWLGQTLGQLLELVIDDPALNRKDLLLVKAMKYLREVGK